MREKIKDFLNNFLSKEGKLEDINDDYFRTKVNEMLVQKGEFYTTQDAKIIGNFNEQERKEFMQKMTSFYLKAKNITEQVI